jgi:hypothetical protein
MRTHNLDEEAKDSPKQHIAIVGGGFAGLTIAAALAKKAPLAAVTLFERRDTVLPPQNGCDTRWLHPNIYAWPNKGSEQAAANLPILNWGAGRASDVVVQVLNAWRHGMKCSEADIDVYCNAENVNVSVNARKGLTVAWSGTKRLASDPSRVSSEGPGGRVRDFDHVVLAVGFGLEIGATHSYWRNETLGQPRLRHARMTYIVSGGGDGALIDLLRLKIAHFRQDRILIELFGSFPELTHALQRLASENPLDQYDQFEALLANNSDMREVSNNLAGRLRNDTIVILHLKPGVDIRQISTSDRSSFQNRLLAFLLSRCADGFRLSTSEIEVLARAEMIDPERIIKRHGVKPHEELANVLSEDLLQKAEKPLQAPRRGFPPGYFVEYLPPPLEAMAEWLCLAIANHLLISHGKERRLRVTLLRRLVSGDQGVVLQQCCTYYPRHRYDRDVTREVIPTNVGVIGAAYGERKVIRTKKDCHVSGLRNELKELHAPSSSREVGNPVASIAAIPLLTTKVAAGNALGIIGVLYMDSYKQDYFSEDSRLEVAAKMCDAFLATIASISGSSSGGLENLELGSGEDDPDLQFPFSGRGDWHTLEIVDLAPPAHEHVAQLNIDFSALEPDLS